MLKPPAQWATPQTVKGSIVHEAVTRVRVIEDDCRERVTEPFAECHSRIELVTDAVRAADVVGA
jgi:hypothetical protein